MEEIIHVGFGEFKVSRNPNAVLVCFGLGSCVAVSFYDKAKQMGGMIHVVLPSGNGKSSVNPTRFADTGIPLLVDRMVRLGASKERMVVKLVGGAKILKMHYLANEADIGTRNVQKCKEVLKQLGFHIEGSDVGGTHGRTVRLHVGTGETFVRQRGEKTL